MPRMGKTSRAKWDFDCVCGELPDECRAERTRLMEQFRTYVRDGKTSCMVVGLPGSGRHVLVDMMKPDLEWEGKVVQTSLARLGSGVEAFGRLIKLLGAGTTVKDGNFMSLEEANDAFVSALEERLKNDDRWFFLIVDSFDSCCRMTECNEFVRLFFDTRATDWKRLRFVPVLVSTRCPDMILKSMPGLTSRFAEYYNQRRIDVTCMTDSEFAEVCSHSRRTLGKSEMELLCRRTGRWPVLAAYVLRTFNRAVKSTLEDALRDEETLERLCEHHSRWMNFLSEFRGGFGLGEGETLFTCLSSLVAGSPFSCSCRRSVFNTFCHYGLGRFTDNGEFQCTLPESFKEFVRQNDAGGSVRMVDGGEEVPENSSTCFPGGKRPVVVVDLDTQSVSVKEGTPDEFLVFDAGSVFKFLLCVLSFCGYGAGIPSGSWLQRVQDIMRAVTDEDARNFRWLRFLKEQMSPDKLERAKIGEWMSQARTALRNIHVEHVFPRQNKKGGQPFEEARWTERYGVEWRSKGRASCSFPAACLSEGLRPLFSR